MAKRNITLHDKYKSTTALYPKIDAKSLTPKAIEEITKITEVVVEEQVVPNPTLAGTEADLTGIQIGDVKYKVPEGGGTENHLYLYQCHWGHPSTDSLNGEYGLVTFCYKEFLLPTQARELLKTFLRPYRSIYASGSKYSKLNNKLEIIKRMFLENDTFKYETIDTQNTVVGQSYLTYSLADEDLAVEIIQMF